MALPTYQSQASANTGSTGVQADITSFLRGGGPNAGRAIQAGLDDVGEVLDKRRREDEAVWVNNVASQADLQWAKRLEDLQNGPDAGKPGFTKMVEEEFMKFHEDQIANAPTNSSQAMLNSHLNGLGENVLQKAMMFEAQERLMARQKEIASAIDAKTALAYRTNSFEEILSLAEGQSSVVDGISGLRPSQREALKLQSREIITSGIRGLGDRDPKKFLDLYQEGKLDGKIDGTQLVGLVQHYQAALTSKRNADNFKFKQLKKDNLQKIEDYGKPVQNIPDELKDDEYIAREAQAMDMFQGKEVIRNHTPEQGEVYLQDYERQVKDSVGSPMYSFMQENLQKLRSYHETYRKDLREDPAKAVLTDPSLRDMKQEADNAMASAGNDPQQKAGAIKMFRDYLDKSRADQIARGVLPENVRYATNEELGNIGFELNKKSTDLDAFLIDLKGIKERYGDERYDSIISGLQQKSLGDNAISGIHAIIASKDTTSATMKPILAAAALTSKQLNERIAELNRADLKETSFQTAAGANETLKALRSSFAGIPERENLYTSYSDYAQHYAKYLVATGKSTSPKDAIQRAVDAAWKDEFTFKDYNGRAMPIPLKNSSGARFNEQRDVPLIKARLDGIVRMIEGSKPGQFIRVDQFNQAGAAGLTPEDQHEGNIEIISRGYAWVNEGKTAGLYVDVDGYGSLQPVKDKDGKEISLSFDDLAYKPWSRDSLKMGVNTSRLDTNDLFSDSTTKFLPPKYSKMPDLWNKQQEAARNRLKEKGSK